MWRKDLTFHWTASRNQWDVSPIKDCRNCYRISQSLRCIFSPHFDIFEIRLCLTIKIVEVKWKYFLFKHFFLFLSVFKIVTSYSGCHRRVGIFYLRRYSLCPLHWWSTRISSLWLSVPSFFIFWYWGLNSGLCICRQAFYCWSHISSPFCSGYFGYRLSLFVQASLDYNPTISCFTPLQKWQVHATMLSCWLKWGLSNFLPELASNHDLPDRPPSI
jgi:hypothetical protein